MNIKKEKPLKIMGCICISAIVIQYFYILYWSVCKSFVLKYTQNTHLLFKWLWLLRKKKKAKARLWFICCWFTISKEILSKAYFAFRNGNKYINNLNLDFSSSSSCFETNLHKLFYKYSTNKMQMTIFIHIIL